MLRSALSKLPTSTRTHPPAHATIPSRPPTPYTRIPTQTQHPPTHPLFHPIPPPHTRIPNAPNRARTTPPCCTMPCSTPCGRWPSRARFGTRHVCVCVNIVCFVRQVGDCLCDCVVVRLDVIRFDRVRHVRVCVNMCFVCTSCMRFDPAVTTFQIPYPLPPSPTTHQPPKLKKQNKTTTGRGRRRAARLLRVRLPPHGPGLAAAPPALAGAQG